MPDLSDHRRLLRTVLLGCCSAMLSTATLTLAQTYPSRPIRFVVPYVPGGGVDFVGRTVAQKLTETWSHPVIVDNRPGAGTNIGSEYVARAVADGHTLLVGGVPNAVNMTLYRKPPYDVIRDFAAITQLSTAPNVLVVHASVPVRSVKALIALAKLHRGELLYASAGIGSSNHLSGALFNVMANVNIIHVPYKGGGAAVTDLVAGNISMYFGTTPSTVPFVRNGRLRALGVTSAKRSAAVPDIPTIAESGLPGYEQSAWHGLFAPAATPQTILSKLQNEVVRIINLPDMVERFTAQGVNVVGSSSEEFALYLKNDVAKYAKLVKAANIPIE